MKPIQNQKYVLLNKGMLGEYGARSSRKVPMAVKEQEKETIFALHVFGNLYKIDPTVINDLEFLKKTMLEAVDIAHMSLVDIRAWAFGGKKGGISVIALVEESHLVLHTWNEYNYATLDIYTCGEDSDPKAAFDHVIKQLKPEKHQVFTMDRSQLDIA